MDELDIVMTEQLYSARRRQKLIKRLRRIMPTDPGLIKAEIQIEQTILYIQSMINDKKAKPKKRINIKKILYRFIIHCKFIYLAIILGKKKR
jgi:hypothetical protein